MRSLLILIMILSPLTAIADCATNWMDCTTDSPLEIGSFTLQATEVIGAITNSRLTAVQKLQRHEISAAQAQIVQSKADRARTLWQQARDICNADSAGNCQSDSAKAFALLTSAQKALQ
jgi:hypothetical protein